MEPVRLNKFLSEAGFCSRRKADELIDAGRVTVDGSVAVPGLKVTDESEILVDGRKISGEKAAPILLAVNKPRGIVCTTTGRDKDNIVDFLHYPERIYPVGRLDKDSEGLILMTNQGELMNRILKGSNGHEKEYIVRVRQPITEEFIRAMRDGVPIPDMNREYRKNPDAEADDVPVVMTKRCKVDKINDYTFRIVLTQGLNRQIRRMCDFLGYRVVSLKRVRVLNIRLGDLESGQYRVIEGEEYNRLLQLVKMEQEDFAGANRRGQGRNEHSGHNGAERQNRNEGSRSSQNTHGNRDRKPFSNDKNPRNHNSRTDGQYTSGHGSFEHGGPGTAVENNVRESGPENNKPSGSGHKTIAINRNYRRRKDDEA